MPWRRRGDRTLRLRRSRLDPRAEAGGAHADAGAPSGPFVPARTTRRSVTTRGIGRGRDRTPRDVRATRYLLVERRRRRRRRRRRGRRSRVASGATKERGSKARAGAARRRRSTTPPGSSSSSTRARCSNDRRRRTFKAAAAAGRRRGEGRGAKFSPGGFGSRAGGPTSTGALEGRDAVGRARPRRRRTTGARRRRRRRVRVWVPRLLLRGARATPPRRRGRSPTDSLDERPRLPSDPRHPETKERATKRKPKNGPARWRRVPAGAQLETAGLDGSDERHESAVGGGAWHASSPTRPAEVHPVRDQPDGEDSGRNTTLGRGTEKTWPTSSRPDAPDCRHADAAPSGGWWRPRRGSRGP